MYHISFVDKVREWIGYIGWKMFLWSIRMTQEQYLNAIRTDEEGSGF